MTTQHHACATCGRRDIRLYRVYGAYLRDEEIFCKAHRPDEPFYVPLWEDSDGTVWGDASAPDAAIRRWEALNDG